MTRTFSVRCLRRFAVEGKTSFAQTELILWKNLQGLLNFFRKSVYVTRVYSRQQESLRLYTCIKRSHYRSSPRQEVHFVQTIGSNFCFTIYFLGNSLITLHKL